MRHLVDVPLAVIVAGEICLALIMFMLIAIVIATVMISLVVGVRGVGDGRRAAPRLGDDKRVGIEVTLQPHC